MGECGQPTKTATTPPACLSSHIYFCSANLPANAETAYRCLEEVRETTVKGLTIIKKKNEILVGFGEPVPSPVLRFRRFGEPSFKYVVEYKGIAQKTVKSPLGHIFLARGKLIEQQQKRNASDDPLARPLQWKPLRIDSTMCSPCLKDLKGMPPQGQAYEAMAQSQAMESLALLFSTSGEDMTFLCCDDHQPLSIKKPDHK